MPEEVSAEAEVSEEVEPAELTDQESIEAPDTEGEPDSPALAELINDETLSEVLEHPAVRERIAEEQRRAEQSARNKLQAEQRRNLNPEVVTQTAAQVLREAGIDPQTLTRSQVDRLTNLYATVRRGAAESLAEEIPAAFFNSYELSDTVRADYLEAVNAGETDRAIATLVDGAVAQKTAELEAATEKRIEVEVDKRVKQELEAASQNGGPVLPTTTRGSRAGNTGLQLTSAEIERMPSHIWVGLPDEAKQAITMNVAEADASRGAETVDQNRLERVAGLVR